MNTPVESDRAGEDGAEGVTELFFRVLDSLERTHQYGMGHKEDLSKVATILKSHSTFRRRRGMSAGGGLMDDAEGSRSAC